MTLKGQCHEIFISVFPQFLSFWTPFSYAKVFLYMISILGRSLHMQKPRSVIDTAESKWFTQFFKFSLLFAVLRNFQHCFFFMIKTQLDPGYEEAYRFWRYFSTVFFGEEKNHADTAEFFYDTAVTELYCAMTYMTPCYQLVTMTPRGQKYRFEYLREIEAIFENLSENHSGAQMVLFSETNLGVTWQLTSK